MLVCCLYYSTATIAQPVVFINAGSRAPWGNMQELWINANGQCRYFLKEANGAVKDSSIFMLEAGQLDLFFLQAVKLGFYALPAMNDGGVNDGAGILVSMNDKGKKHRVQLLNTENQTIKALVDYLNGFLAIHKVIIFYGPAPKPRTR